MIYLQFENQKLIKTNFLELQDNLLVINLEFLTLKFNVVSSLVSIFNEYLLDG